jgi:hypothetical protein
VVVAVVNRLFWYCRKNVFWQKKQNAFRTTIINNINIIDITFGGRSSSSSSSSSSTSMHFVYILIMCLSY